MSKLEYLLSISFYLGGLDNFGIEFDLSRMDIEDLTTLCGVVLDDFYNSEFSYLNEFLNDRIEPNYLNNIANRLGLV